MVQNLYLVCRLAVVFNGCGSTCGVPQYSIDLCNSLGARLFTRVEDFPSDLDGVIYQCCMDTYNGEYTGSEFLNQLNDYCKTNNVPLLTMVHVVPFRNYLSPASHDFLKSVRKYSSAMAAHSQLAKQELQKAEISDVVVIPHGCHGELLMSRPQQAGLKKLTIATFGTMRQEKGFGALIELTKSLNAKLKVFSRVDFSNQVSHKEFQNLTEVSNEIECEIITSYLSNETVINELSKSDLIVFPYPERSKFVASSGAIRLALCAGVPVFCTNAPRFSCLSNEVYKYTNFSELVSMVERFKQEPHKRDRLLDNASKFVLANSWGNIANTYRTAIRTGANAYSTT
jgi:hypothetical protein